MITPPPSPSEKAVLPDFNQAEFQRFRRLLEEKCGLFFDDNKLSVMRTVIQERMHLLETTTYDAYYARLIEPAQSSPLESGLRPALSGYRVLSREMRRLVEGLAVNETAFFRNREHYRALQEEVLPRLLRRQAQLGKKHLRIWSAACSTGQEPYSLAITTLETLKRLGYNPAEWQIHILATDISEKALRLGYAGRYRSDELRGVSPEQLKEYFQPLTAQNVATAPLDPAEIYKPGRSNSPRYRQRIAYEVVPQIREMVSFLFFNLVTATYSPDKFHDFDLVLCENVTIYFTPEVTRQVINNIYTAMNDGGFLFIGYSETLWQVSDRFKLINTQDTFYYQKPFPHETAVGYIRSQPTTGPLPAETPQKITSPIRRTDELAKSASRPATQPERQNKTDPLVPIANLPVIGNNQPSRTVSEMDTPPPPAKPGVRPGQPNRLQWMNQLTEGKRQMGDHDFEQARLSLEAALATAPNEVEVLNTLAELKLKLGDYATAMKLCQRAVNLNRLSEAAHLMLAMIFHKEGRIEEAIKEYQYTIYINPEAVIAYIRLADIYRDSGHQRDSLREYRQALNVLQQKAPDEMIEDLSVGLLIQACQQNITRLTPRSSR